MQDGGPGSVVDRGAVRRERGWKLLEFLNEESSLPRLRRCGHAIAQADGVPLIVKAGVPHFGNLVSCASVHACPRCAPKIRQKRAMEIEQLLDLHSRAGGGSEFVTLTVPHDYGDQLERLLGAVQAAWNALQRNRDGRSIKERFGFVGFVRSLEVTHGPNGWHPHLHVLWLTDRPLRNYERHQLHIALHQAWATAAEAAGLRRPTLENGVDVRDARRGSGLGRYLVGLEMARSDLKAGGGEHRAAFQILADAAETAGVADLMRWREYEQATHGRRALTWSRGLKARYGIGETTDEELVDENVGGEEVGRVSPPLWVVVRRTRGARSELRRIMVEDGRDGVGDYLARLEAENMGALPIGAGPPRSPAAAASRAVELTLAHLRVARGERHPLTMLRR